MAVLNLDEYIKENPKSSGYYTPTFAGDYIEEYVLYLQNTIQTAEQYLQSSSKLFKKI